MGMGHIPNGLGKCMAVLGHVQHCLILGNKGALPLGGILSLAHDVFAYLFWSEMITSCGETCQKRPLVETDHLTFVGCLAQTPPACFTLSEQKKDKI